MDISLPYKDVPIEIKSEINQLTSNSTVALLGYDEKQHPISDLLATGTFIEINSIYGVLTAKHVWEKFKKKAENISFSYFHNTHLTLEKIEYLRCYSPDNEIDICFIEIPLLRLDSIKAASSFHPIISESYSDSTEIENRLCITVGFPLEIQSTTERKIDILRYYTHVIKHSIISKDWDIIELDIKAADAPNELPKSFGGMSGGGIWSFKLFYNLVNNERKYFIRKNLKDALLAGVNYRQDVSKSNGKVNKITGVGPISIYYGMTKLVKK